jgi:hypothetical protein
MNSIRRILSQKRIINIDSLKKRKMNRNSKVDSSISSEMANKKNRKVLKSNIPEHFKKGLLYKILIKNNNNLNISYNKDIKYYYFKDSIESIEDLDNLLDTYNYWKVDTISSRLFFYCYYFGGIIKELINNDKKYKYIMDKIGQIYLGKLTINIIKKNKKFNSERMKTIVFNKNINISPNNQNRLITTIIYNILKRLYHLLYTKNNNLTLAFAKEGYLDCLKYANEIGCPLNKDTTYGAASNGHLDCLKYAHENDFPWDEKTTYGAASNGHLDCLKYAHENDCPWDKDTTYGSASNGYLDCLKYAHENNCLWDKKAIANAAAINGHLDCLEYTHKNGCTLKPYIVTLYTAQNGHLDCLMYLHKNNCPWNEETTCNAALKGHLECLKYAHDNKCPWDKKTTQYAAQNGHLECLKYAHENKCPWDEKTTASAAGSGDLECLKYAHENKCPWNEETTASAAFRGSLECLKYAHENDCQWNKNTTKWAASNGHLECLIYAHKNGCPWDKETTMSAVLSGHWKCFEYAYDNDCPFDNLNVPYNLDIRVKEYIEKLIKIKEKRDLIIKKIEDRPKSNISGKKYMIKLLQQGKIYIEPNIRKTVIDKVINRLKTHTNFLSLIPKNK